MNQSEWNGTPGEMLPENRAFKEPKPRRTYTLGTLIGVVCVVVAVAVLLTYTLTAASKRKYWQDRLIQQQAVIEEMQEASMTDFGSGNLGMLAKLFERYSYYADTLDETAMMNAVLKAYATASGDRYAEYYTEEEYLEMNRENNGDYEGIGVSVVNSALTVDGYEYTVFRIITIYENAPAQTAGLAVGDCIFAVKTGESYQTVAALGYTAAVSAIRGERGTQAELLVFRPQGDSYERREFKVMRDSFVSVSVSSFLTETDPTVAVIRISNFDLTTPSQFRSEVNARLADGAKHFVFDVRNNPGGDLQSIKAVLTFFLQKGDLILSSVDKDGKTVSSQYAGAMTLTGSYASCNVSEEEIGMYAGLDAAVLCNGNTASAAEVFTATLRDYGLAKIIGEKTFGKGIMQSFLPLSNFGNYQGYLKLTTYAYVTKCGITYHEIGILPSTVVSLSEEAKGINLFLLPQSQDSQLQAAIASFSHS